MNRAVELSSFLQESDGSVFRDLSDSIVVEIDSDSEL